MAIKVAFLLKMCKTDETFSYTFIYVRLFCVKAHIKVLYITKNMPIKTKV